MFSCFEGRLDGLHSEDTVIVQSLWLCDPRWEPNRQGTRWSREEVGAGVGSARWPICTLPAHALAA